MAWPCRSQDTVVQMKDDPTEIGLKTRNGADETRTHNLLDATEALSQLSYCPILMDVYPDAADPFDRMLRFGGQYRGPAAAGSQEDPPV